MDIWCTIHVFTFPFLVTSCASAMAQPITNHHNMWSGTYYSFTSDELCAHFVVYHVYLSHLYLPFKPERKFSPQISDLVCSAWSFHLTPLHTFSLLHTCLASYPLPCTISHSLLSCQDTVHYPLITPQNFIGFTLQSSFMAHSCWSKLCPRHINAHQCMIKNLTDNTEGGHDSVTVAPSQICEGCKKGKSKQLPFPPSKSRAVRPLDLVHSNLQFTPLVVISGPQPILTITHLIE